MTTTPAQGPTTRDGVRAARVLGHLAVYYRPGTEEAARTLLGDLGCELVDNGPRPGEDGFATALLDAATADHHDNVVYVARMGDAQWALEQRIDALLGSDEGCALAERVAEWPESAPHAGIVYDSLDDLEATLRALDRHAAPGGPLHGHVEVVRYRARPGLDAAVDARMAASPVFTDDDRPAFGDHIVQCFVHTDLFGSLTSTRVIELDFAFPRFFDNVPTFGR